MIESISFEELDESVIEKLKEYSPLVDSNYLTRIGSTVVLPSDCMPRVHTQNGITKDSLHILYSNLKKNFETDGNVEESRAQITQELKLRWNGKNGRWRQHLCGKRTNFTARSVLSPNATLELDEVCLPNIFKRRLLKEDIFEDETAVVYILENDMKYDARFRTPVIGQKILREIREGELVLVNRQPTLRNSNFVAMHVVWNNTSDSTIQIHPANLSMFDADCDGDEVNIHVPQTPDDMLRDFHISRSLHDISNTRLRFNQSVIQDAVVGLCPRVFKNKFEIHTNIKDPLKDFKDAYEFGFKHAYASGFSIGFDFAEIDTMVDTGAKGNQNHKLKIRELFHGIKTADMLLHCKLSRIAMISTSLKTASTGYISRKLSYHLDDVRIVNCNIQEFGFYTSYPTNIPREFKKFANIGLQLVSVLIPPLTQKLLDSFHFAAAGEEVVDETSLFNSLVNCTHPKITQIYTDSGIIQLNTWLFDQFTTFFDDFNIDPFWIHLLSDFLTITGKPIGIDLFSLSKRHVEYTKFDRHHSTPILKILKFSKPTNIIKMVENGRVVVDTLNSNHSKELFNH